MWNITSGCIFFIPFSSSSKNFMVDFRSDKLHDFDFYTIIYTNKSILFNETYQNVFLMDN